MEVIVGINKKYLVYMALLLCLGLAGCGSALLDDSNPTVNAGDPNSLDNLKIKAAEKSEYKCDFSRRFGTESIQGQLYYNNENIRFEMVGASPEDKTITIVNQEEDKTYTYNTLMNKGQMDEPAAFLLDVPLPGEIMSVLTVDNCSFTGQSEREGKKCTAFRAADVQFYGYKFSGEIMIDNETGLPLFISGKRGEIPVVYEYKNFSADVSASVFIPPSTVSFD